MIVKVKNMSVLIDAPDLQTFNRFNWHISDTGYVVWRGILGGKKRTVRLHRLVTRATDGEIVDHINRNKLDNRRKNLRIVDFATNVKNSDRYDNAKHYYFDSNKKRWAIDSKKYGIRSLYMDSEKDCKDFLRDIDQGKTPNRAFTRRVSLSGRKISDEQIDYIFDEFSLGKTKRSIANALGFSESAVGRIINGRTTMGGKISRRGPKADNGES